MSTRDMRLLRKIAVTTIVINRQIMRMDSEEQREGIMASLSKLLKKSHGA
jgi:hypothetical protein